MIVGGPCGGALRRGCVNRRVLGVALTVECLVRGACRAYEGLLDKVLPAMLRHPAVVVREALLRLIRVLLVECCSALEACADPLLDAAARLCADADADVVRLAMCLVADWRAASRLVPPCSLPLLMYARVHAVGATRVRSC